MPGVYTVHLAKEAFKFSCSHFTILSEARAERLHGHNYQVQVHLKLSATDPKLGMAIDVNAIKPFIVKLCSTLDEHILLPGKSPYLRIQTDAASVRVSFGDKHYVFPKEDTISLDVSNITVEELARYLCEQLHATFSQLPQWSSLRVQVEETRGQGASYEI